LFLCACTSIAPREGYMAWSTPCSDGLTVNRVRFIDSPTPTLDCIRAAPPADAARMVFWTLMGFPPMACIITMPGSATVYVNMNMGRISDEQVQHELEHQWGMQHPETLPFVHNCKTESYD